MLHLTIEKVVPGGDGLARVDGQVIFVPEALPGEVVLVDGVMKKKGFGRAQIHSIIKPSPLRVEPPCPHYKACGGCNAQHVSHGGQIECKLTNIKDAWERIAKLEVPPLESLVGKPWSYRNRMQLHKENPGKPWGLKGRKLESIIPIPHCMVAVKPIISHILEGPSPNSPQRCMVFSPPSGEIYIQGRDHVATCEVNHTKLTFSLGSFFQSNIGLLEQFSALVPSLVPKGEPKIMLDLYGGCGTMTALFLPHIKGSVIIEEDFDNVTLAKKNFPTQAVEIHGGTVESWIEKNTTNVHDYFIVVDPPREGLSPEVCTWINQSTASHLIYISCDPITQARDARLLAQGGFSFTRLIHLDFYPQTWHMETCLVAERSPLVV